ALCRFRPFRAGFDRAGTRVTLSAPTSIRRHDSQGDDAGVVAEIFRYESASFGSAMIRQTIVAVVGDGVAPLAGSVVFWDLLELPSRMEYGRSVLAECERQLAWTSYAISYDRILLRTPFYLEAVG